METVSWIINMLAVAAWIINIRNRKWAMILFTLTTILAIGYFGITAQVPFLLRSVFYLFIDIATLWHIAKREGHPTPVAPGEAKQANP